MGIGRDEHRRPSYSEDIKRYMYEFWCYVQTDVGSRSARMHWSTCTFCMTSPVVGKACNIWAASWENGCYSICEQRRLRQACASTMVSPEPKIFVAVSDRPRENFSLRIRHVACNDLCDQQRFRSACASAQWSESSLIAFAFYNSQAFQSIGGIAVNIKSSKQATKCSRTSMARTSLEPWKFFRDMGSSSHWGLIMTPV